MTFRHLLLPVSLLGYMASTGTLWSAQPWTLERAVATALEGNPDAGLARQRIAAADAMIEQANAAWRPQIMLNGRYTQTDSPMMAFGSILNQRAFNFGLDFNRPGWIDNLNATGTVAYNLYSGGRATAGREAARAGSRAAQEDLRTTRHLIASSVVKAWLGIVKAREGVTAVEAGVRAYEAALEAARARFEAGQMLRSDLLNLEVQLAQTRESLSSTRHGAALAERAFMFALGQPATADRVELDPTDSALAQLTPPATNDFSARPELAALRERERAAAAMQRAARGGRQPNVDAFASYQYDHGWKTARGDDSWMAGVSVDLKVFDGGQTSGRVRQAAAELAQVREMIRRATLGIELEVAQARLALADARERIAVSARSVEQATESAALSRARFEEGGLLTSDLIAVESRLIEARMRRTVAEADERLALVEFRRALGLSPLPEI
jgi:outer membrane protein TolC